MKVGLTRLQIRRKLLPNSKHQHLLPEPLTLILLNAERPRSAVDVAAVLPNRLDAALEEVHRVLQLKGMHGEIIEEAPEWFEGHDVVENEGDALVVGFSLAVFVVVEVPGVFEGRRTHAMEHGQALLFALCGTFGRSGGGGRVFRDGG